LFITCARCISLASVLLIALAIGACGRRKSAASAAPVPSEVADASKRFTPKKLATHEMPSLLGVDERDAYWYVGAEIHVTPLDGSAPRVVTAKDEVFYGVAGGAAFGARPDDADPMGALFDRVPLDGSPPTTIARVPSSSPLLQAWFVDDRSVVLVHTGTPEDARMEIFPTSGGASKILADHRRSVVAVAADETHVYWSEGEGRTEIFGVPRSGGAITKIAGTATASSALVVDH
jgi:hypothetical protein